MEPSKKIGRYEILEELGHGAMGTVYRAKDPAMDRIVALKTIITLMLASEQGSEFRERFYREARAAGGLAHPGIVTMFDVGEHEGVPFMVMEFVSGRTLADAVKKGERLSLERVCEIGQKISEALGYAHMHGVVHRDIKPANILLTSRETYGIERPKITDFGVAKLAEGQTTLTGQILGTPAFMPPEQFTGSPIDGRADIFSLGVVLYWMATGEQPFPGESVTSVSYKVVHTDPVPPRKLNPSISAKLENIILKCLAKSPDDRYQTGDELARDLGELQPGGKAAALQTRATQATGGIDPDATLVESGPPRQIAPATVVPPPTQAVAPSGKSNNRFVLAAVVAVMLLAGGWFVMRSREKRAAQENTDSAVAISQTPPPAPIPVIVSDNDSKAVGGIAEATPGKAATKAPVGSKPLESASNKQEAKVAALNAIHPSKEEVPVPGPSPVNFDPKGLDPKGNARLKIEADQAPLDLDFTVEMNGQVYMRSSVEGNKKEYDDLYVPPGVQEFSVTAKNGAVQKTSNIVSTEFKAKKRKTLKIELRTQGSSQGSGVPKALYPDSQLVVTLK
jgi:eukaryotic-like serine/threonine-protein kinase